MMRKEIRLSLPICGKGQEGKRLIRKAAKNTAAVAAAVTLAVQYCGCCRSNPCRPVPLCVFRRRFRDPYRQFAELVSKVL